MARAHSRKVIDAVITALAAIHTDNGDSFTPQIASRWDADRSVEGPLPALLIRRISNPRTRDQGSGWLNTLSIEITAYLYTGDDVVEAGDEVIEEAEEDVWRALQAIDAEALEGDFRSFSAVALHDLDEEHPVDGFRADVVWEWKQTWDDPDTILPSTS